MPFKFAFLALCAFLVAASLPAAPAAGGTRTQDIVYAQAGKHGLKLDLYLPDTPAPDKKGWPVVVYFHGGGWRVGSKAEGAQYAELFNRNGIALASVDYRLSGEAIWPAQIHDAKAAIRWTRANARRYGLDPARIGAMGASAGGHSASLLGTTEGVKALEDLREGNPNASSRVRAVCDISGPVDMMISTDRIIGKLAVYGEFGGSAPEKPDAVRQADPSRYVKGGEPPFLLIFGEKDGLVVPAHAYKLQKALKAHGDDVTLDLVPGGGHVPMRGDKQREEALTFFKKHLG